MSERISETITFHFDNVEQQKRFHERLEGWSGLTPSEHGSSAALRALVIEECAKVAEERAASALALMNGAKRAGDLDDATQHLLVWTESAAIASVIRSLSAVSAIAQERDVGEPVAWLRWNSYFHASPHGQDAEGNEALELCEPVDRNAFPVYLHPTTSPSAISEAPTSADAECDK